MEVFRLDFCHGLLELPKSASRRVYESIKGGTSMDDTAHLVGSEVEYG